jgi:hypothetical protein
MPTTTPVRVRTTGWQEHDAPELAGAVVIGRAEVRPHSGGLYKALLVWLPVDGRDDVVRRKAAVYWDKARDAFVIAEVP